MVAGSDPTFFRIVAARHLFKRYPSFPVVTAVFYRIWDEAFPLRTDRKPAGCLPADIPVFICEYEI